jgi:hypothetical protein
MLSRDDLSGAVTHLETALALARRIVEKAPGTMRASDLGATEAQLGGLYLQSGRYAEGKKLVEKGLSRLIAMEQDDPGNQLLRLRVADTLDDLGTRTFSAAKGQSASLDRQRSLLRLTVAYWTGCRDRTTKASSEAGVKCGGAQLQEAIVTLRALPTGRPQ